MQLVKWRRSYVIKHVSVENTNSPTDHERSIMAQNMHLTRTQGGRRGHGAGFLKLCGGNGGGPKMQPRQRKLSTIERPTPHEMQQRIWGLTSTPRTTLTFQACFQTVGCTDKNPHMHWRNMQTPHKKVPAGI